RAIYNVRAAWRLSGSLKVEALEQSINTIVQRHEILRTTFVVKEGRPLQLIAPELSLSLPVVDLTELDLVKRGEQASHLTKLHAGAAFDLRHGPLLRVTLLKVNVDEYLLLITMHHTISDGWSMSVLKQELIMIYQAHSQGQSPELPALPIQYADYALWQRQRLQGEVLQHHLEYWRRQLQGSPAILTLPTDRPRPPVQTFSGATHELILPVTLTRSLHALSQQEGVTFFTTLLAAFQALLLRYTQQEDISVGTYIAGRTQRATENLIGFFINNLVLRTDLSGDPSFRHLLQRASQVTQGAYEHQEVPFERLVQALRL